ncbi:MULTISPECIES: DsbA family protein [unclassified Wolbachia]|uniref:DsbA family protein n=1 Tax=unclassified Wolbachia TaxID=2640676 RepID=UPI00019864F0|nr:MULTISPECIES: DsbA family protein [unclassified Wolbachia]POG51427.1 disulfide bond formation protein DsbA [Wolbachia sp. wRi_2]ACN96011.1 DsbA-like disulfide oxidoreductase [Wolbachia sp. wRi]POG52824.1 disulfide bond formation protein DsbA [Wolbachia sp. wRi]QEF50997.1 thioredoxin family protein [Wolbachia endosymbiont of Drosophila ananassae]RLT59823.1 thioredoxin-like domain protein [Wolbachia endosymbiont of Drosophila ananassae]
MSRISFLLILILAVASLPVINNWLSHRGQTLTDDQISTRLDDYISRNFDKIVKTLKEESIKSSYAARDNVTKSKISQYKDEIFDLTYPYSGNENSSVIVAGFLDYSCGYCKAMKNDIKQLINDGKIKYIFRDAPILSNASLKAAKSALAVYFLDKEKYFDFHHAALSHKGEFSDESILDIVKNIGIDEDDFNDSIKDNADKIEQMINNSRLLVRDLGVGGTPFLIIGDSLFVGATDLNVLRKKVDELSHKQG